MSELTAAQVMWLRSGERGMSSEALFERLTGHAICGRGCLACHPYDPADLRRCLLMLEQCGLVDRLHEAADLSGPWARLIGSWAKIVATLEGEVADWRKPTWGASAHGTYGLMRRLTDG